MNLAITKHPSLPMPWLKCISFDDKGKGCSKSRVCDILLINMHRHDLEWVEVREREPSKSIVSIGALVCQQEIVK